MSASDDRDDFILQETLDGKSARAISRQLRCTVGEAHSTLDRVLPTIDNEARMRHIALDLSRLDQLLAVFLKRVIEDKDQPSGMLCVKILERKAALLPAYARGLRQRQQRQRRGTVRQRRQRQ